MSPAILRKLGRPLVTAAASAVVLVVMSQAAPAGSGDPILIDRKNAGHSFTQLTGNYNGNLFVGVNTNTSADAVGVAGVHYARSGVGPGVFGFTNSTAPEAMGVRGDVRPHSTGLDSAGVRGVNWGTGDNGIGVWGQQRGSGIGVFGYTPDGRGVFAKSDTGTGLEAQTKGENDTAVFADHDGALYGYGVIGSSDNGVGVVGFSHGGDPGVAGVTDVDGETGVSGIASGTNGIGIFGRTNDSCVPGGQASFGGVIGADLNTGAAGALGACGSDGGRGVSGVGGVGVHGFSQHTFGIGVEGVGEGPSATAISGTALSGADAGRFSGNVSVLGDVSITGNLSKGGGSFLIDDPLDPANMYLQHSFVESPDMMNVYNGNVVTDAHGLAIVRLPRYFQALNRDFRYQLTVLGQFAQAIVWKEIAQNRFTIRTDKPRVRVSWQVTGIRKDAWANANRIQVHVAKTGADRGRYLYPELFGAPASQAIGARGPDRILTIRVPWIAPSWLKGLR